MAGAGRLLDASKDVLQGVRIPVVSTVAATQVVAVFLLVALGYPVLALRDITMPSLAQPTEEMARLGEPQQEGVTVVSQACKKRCVDQEAV